ncbi:hypothetical protein [Orenia marismortui]|uniref:Uncharacterized protein n=1 Tax=Orenia marismortui TaxID=46469 RepID=A0A4V3GYA3_9FIRM|nr:hypothetical protein [Orenia marismortui]TDX51284.1 hypothetical protein C7959_11432 [Orenia marismortui]
MDEVEGMRRHEDDRRHGGCKKDVDFADIIKDLISENIVVIVKSGGACDDVVCCCAWEGTLCSIGEDFILLIGEEGKIYIPVDAIAAIIEDC